MTETKGRWKGVTDKEPWVARRASFLAKVKATRVVWFPPKPVESGKKAASTAKKATATATKRTSGAAKKTTKRSSGAAKKTTRKTTGAARKATSGKL